MKHPSRLEKHGCFSRMLLSHAETCALVYFLCGREETYSNNLTQKGLQTNGKAPKVEGT
jgi:hypothetical protein